MRKTIFNLIAFVLLLTFSGCNYDNFSDVELEESVSKLDLTDPNVSFEQVKESLLLAASIKLKFSEYERVLREIRVNKNIVLDDGVILECENDSISFAVTESYVSIVSRINSNGEDKILIHRDKEYARTYYKNMVLATTRSLNDSTNIRVSLYSNGVLSIRGGWNQQKKHVVRSTVNPNLGQGIEAESHTTRSTSWSPRKSDAIRIWLIRHKGYGASHEITWQQQNVQKMIHKINPKAKIEFYTRGSDFHSGWDLQNILSRFAEWLNTGKQRGYDWSSSVGKDIFMLISHGYYDISSSQAYQSSYSIKRENNPNAIGVAAINPLTADKALAHEIGHILGAKDTNYAWREGWWIFKIWINDVMSHKWPRSAWTLDPSNMAAIRESTTL